MEQKPNRFRGHALQAIDGKGRLAIPAPLRVTMENNAKDRLVLIAVNEADGCLTGSDTRTPELDYDKIEREEERALDQDREARLAKAPLQSFGITEELPYDASGRFILPPFYREEAGLEDWAFFIGWDTHFRIWNPQRLLEGAHQPLLERAVRSCMAQRGLA